MPELEQIEFEEHIYPCAYKVVTSDLKSLGLRRNPNINNYPIRKWYFLDPEEIQEGAEDWGGIWVCRTPSGARKLAKYMKGKYNKETKIFKAALDRILYHNSYRIKTNGIMLLEEIISK